MCSSGNPKRADCARCPESERSPVPEYLSSQNRTALLHKQKIKEDKDQSLTVFNPHPPKKKEKKTNKEPQPVVISCLQMCLEIHGLPA